MEWILKAVAIIEDMTTEADRMAEVVLRAATQTVSNEIVLKAVRISVDHEEVADVVVLAAVTMVAVAVAPVTPVALRITVPMIATNGTMGIAVVMAEVAVLEAIRASRHISGARWLKGWVFLKLVLNSLNGCRGSGETFG